MNFVELATKLRPIIEKAMQSLEVEDALVATSLYPKWASGIQYEAGYRLRYNNVLYNILLAHTSQDDWTPDISPSLYAKVLIPDANIIPDWVQPDSTNPYALGDKVTHNAKIWSSNIDNNVWEPGVYGWTEILE